MNKQQTYFACLVGAIFSLICFGIVGADFALALKYVVEKEYVLSVIYFLLAIYLFTRSVKVLITCKELFMDAKEKI